MKFKVWTEIPQSSLVCPTHPFRLDHTDHLAVASGGFLRPARPRWQVPSKDDRFRDRLREVQVRAAGLAPMPAQTPRPICFRLSHTTSFNEFSIEEAGSLLGAYEAMAADFTRALTSDHSTRSTTSFTIRSACRGNWRVRRMWRMVQQAEGDELVGDKCMLSISSSFQNATFISPRVRGG